MSPAPTTPITTRFTTHLPKLELHAHLTGSITPTTLHEIWQTLPPLTPPLPSPLLALPPSHSPTISTFFPLFTTYIYALLATPASIVHATNAVLYDFMRDGVVYLELRTTPRASDAVSKDEYVRLILSCIEDFSARNYHRMSTFLILSLDRRNTAAEAMDVVALALKYRHRAVVGVDLCGDPTTPLNPSLFAPAFTKAKSHGLKVTLHFAEVGASSSALELQTLLGWEPDRLGHVVCVGEEMRGEILRRGVGVELCVSCNVLAGMTDGGVGGHHFGEWWNRGEGAKVVLCTDDVGVFGSKLSNEYLLVAQHFGLSRKDLLELCGRGVDVIFGGESEKARIREKLKVFGEEMDE